MICFQTANAIFESDKIVSRTKPIVMVNNGGSTVKHVQESNEGLDVPEPVAKVISLMFGGGGYRLHKSGDRWRWVSPNCMYEIDAQLYERYRAVRFRAWIRRGKSIGNEPMVDYIIVDNSKRKVRKSASTYVVNKEAKH